MNHRPRIQSLALIFLLLLFLSACSLSEPTAQPPTPTREASDLPPAVDSPGSASLGDSLYAGFGNGGYDVQHYTLNLTVTDVESGEMEGVVTIDARAAQDLDAFNLDFIGYEISAVTVNSNPADFTRADQELTIIPAQPISSGAAFTVGISYSGTPERLESQAAVGRVGWIPLDDGSLVLSEPDGAATYYPVNDHPLDKAAYTFQITVPSDYEVVANGVLSDTSDNVDSVTYVWQATDPMASYLTTVNIGDYDLETDESDSGVPIRNYFAATLDDDAREPFARQAEMIDYFSNVFGPYPFEVYGSIVIDAEVGTALEAQTLSLYGIDQLDLDDIDSAEQLVAHELAHQWFGDSISVADWGDIWLNEGFATYSEGLWIEYTQGTEARDEWVMDNYEYVADYLQDEAPPGTPAADNLFSERIYCQGALTLHALRLQVGDDTFFKIIQTYFDRYQGGNARTADFIAVTEEISGQDLTEFFDSWLYADTIPAIPELDLSSD
ncbi:MAG TPA: M1 family metallopeptidase [Anaerolineaceae bacterium]|nr:M1 family metallopeptidase [Anaerolineaceae bacterium]HNS36217.1 M1 family metallopeptidase [Anaerolineaceae bacterium]